MIKDVPGFQCKISELEKDENLKNFVQKELSSENKTIRDENKNTLCACYLNKTCAFLMQLKILSLFSQSPC